MANLNNRLESLETALVRLEEVCAIENLSDIERDSLILRFQFSFELLWKCGKDYLAEVEGISAASPRRVIRHCCELEIISEEQAQELLRAADDRNLSAHTYDEELARKLETRIKKYAPLFREFFINLQSA